MKRQIRRNVFETNVHNQIMINGKMENLYMTIGKIN